MTPRIIAFADGENLVHRFQDMVKAGRTVAQDTVHCPDLLAWHPEISTYYLCDIVRINFYQTVVGDEPKLDECRQRISAVSYRYRALIDEGDTESGGTLRPRVFKKEGKSVKTKSVDINLTVDALRHALDPRIDAVLLLSGDGDYLPLLREIANRGKQVWLAAFSSGLNKHLKFEADEFIDLDALFFAET